MRKGRVPRSPRQGGFPWCSIRKQPLKLRLEEHMRRWWDNMGRERWADGVLGGERPECKGREDRLRTRALQEQEVTGAGGRRRVAGGERAG